MKITIDLDKLELISKNADKILFSKEGEEEIVKIIEAQEKLEEILKKAKETIEQKALQINPNFKSVEGDKIKVSYRYFGQKYYLEEDKLNEIPAEFYTKEIITKFKVNSDAVENFVEKNGGLPYGVIAPERKKTLTISYKKNENTKA
jgi:hypothetical protein